MPEGAREGILRGMYRVREARRSAKVRLLGAGTILPRRWRPRSCSSEDWQVAAEVYSVTSFTELRREAMEASRAARLGGKAALPWIAQQLPANGVPVVAASDYVSAVADLIRPWIARRATSRWGPTASGAATRARTCADSSRWTGMRSPWRPFTPSATRAGPRR